MTNIEVRAVKPEVTLLNPGDEFLSRIYLAFKTCYAPERPQSLWEKHVSREEMIEYIDRRLQTEHTSPLEQAVFQFAISGVSRVFTHQFVRHRVGVSVAQQSGRYTDPLETGVFEYVQPSMPEASPGKAPPASTFLNSMELAADSYRYLVESGMPREDARMILPNCQATNMAITVNFAALQHMCDIRLCTLAQWEFRKVVALMRAEVKRAEPALAKYLGPKCMAGRRGACDEDEASYRRCPLSAVRPHRTVRSFDLRPMQNEGVLARGMEHYLETEATA